MTTSGRINEKSLPRHWKMQQQGWQANFLFDQLHYLLVAKATGATSTTASSASTWFPATSSTFPWPVNATLKWTTWRTVDKRTSTSTRSNQRKTNGETLGAQECTTTHGPERRLSSGRGVQLNNLELYVCRRRLHCNSLNEYQRNTECLPDTRGLRRHLDRLRFSSSRRRFSNSRRRFSNSRRRFSNSPACRTTTTTVHSPFRYQLRRVGCLRHQYLLHHRDDPGHGHLRGQPRHVRRARRPAAARNYKLPYRYLQLPEVCLSVPEFRRHLPTAQSPEYQFEAEAHPSFERDRLRRDRKQAHFRAPRAADSRQRQ